MVIFVIYLFFKAKPAIERFFDSFGSTPLKQDPGTLAVIFVGMIVIGIVAVVKIMSKR
jgi:preprotein translocase subunit Sec61beta